MVNITKENLDKAIEFFSELNLNNKDYEKIFNKFKLIFESLETKNVLENISNIQEIGKETDNFALIVKKLSESANLGDLNSVLSKLMKNEELINFIQDLFLERLL